MENRIKDIAGMHGSMLLETMDEIMGWLMENYHVRSLLSALDSDATEQDLEEFCEAYGIDYNTALDVLLLIENDAKSIYHYRNLSLLGKGYRKRFICKVADMSISDDAESRAKHCEDMQIMIQDYCNSMLHYNTVTDGMLERTIGFDNTDPRFALALCVTAKEIGVSVPDMQRFHRECQKIIPEELKLFEQEMAERHRRENTGYTEDQFIEDRYAEGYEEY